MVTADGGAEANDERPRSKTCCRGMLVILLVIVIEGPGDKDFKSQIGNGVPPSLRGQRA